MHDTVKPRSHRACRVASRRRPSTRPHLDYLQVMYAYSSSFQLRHDVISTGVFLTAWKLNCVKTFNKDVHAIQSLKILIRGGFDHPGYANVLTNDCFKIIISTPNTHCSVVLCVVIRWRLTLHCRSNCFITCHSIMPSHMTLCACRMIVTIV